MSPAVILGMSEFAVVSGDLDLIQGIVVSLVRRRFLFFVDGAL